MIGYGIACVLVCVLSLFDRRAMPFALVILAEWLLGFLGWRAWPFISLAGGLVVFRLHLRHPTWWSAMIAALCGMMLAADVIYLWFRWHRIAVEVEYARALDVGLILKLLLVGHRGAINGGIRLRDWCVDRLRRGGRLLGA